MCRGTMLGVEQLSTAYGGQVLRTSSRRQLECLPVSHPHDYYNSPDTHQSRKIKGRRLCMETPQENNKKTENSAKESFRGAEWWMPATHKNEWVGKKPQMHPNNRPEGGDNSTFSPAPPKPTRKTWALELHTIVPENEMSNRRISPVFQQAFT